MIPNLLLYSFYNYHTSLIEVYLSIKLYEVESSFLKYVYITILFIKFSKIRCTYHFNLLFIYNYPYINL